jgi:hypothetical protein
MPLLKIALLQMSAHKNDQSANLRKGDQFCRLAKELNIAIAVHPMAFDKKGRPRIPLSSKPAIVKACISQKKKLAATG